MSVGELTNATARKRYQFRTTDLFFLSAVVALAILATKADPVMGPLVSSVFLVVVAGILGMISGKIVATPHPLRHRFAGGALFGILGFRMAINLAPWVQLHDKTVVISFVFFAGAVGGVAGAWLGGLMRQIDRTWQLGPWLSQTVLGSRAGLITIIAASVAMALPVAVSVDPAHAAKTWWILLMLAGGCFGTACTRFVGLLHESRIRVAGAFLGSLTGFYFGLAATYFVVDLAVTIHPGLLTVVSVFAGSAIGGLLGAVLSSFAMNQLARPQRIAALSCVAAIAMGGAAIAWRAAWLERESHIVESIINAGGAIEYGMSDRWQWLFDSKRTSARRFDRLYRFLGLKVVHTVELVDGTFQSELAAVPLETDSKEWIATTLSTVDRLTLHADHLLDNDVLDVLNGGHTEAMQHLAILGRQVDDELFNRLESPDSLTQLIVRGTSITDSVTKEISKLEHLRFLDVTDTQLTNQGASILKSALPECAVYSTLRLDSVAAGRFRKVTESQSFSFTLDKATPVQLERRANRNGLVWSMGGKELVIDRQLDPPEVIYLPAGQYSLTVQHSSGESAYDFSLNSLEPDVD